MDRKVAILKRAIDLAGAAAALTVTGPLFPLIAAAVYIDNPGPIFYAQIRVGRTHPTAPWDPANLPTFRMWKFRSMRVAKPGEPLRLTAHNDDRVTRVGRFIRLHRIDELPQFFNVLLGDMSLVGPRPEVESSVKELRTSLPFYDQRHAIRPGITSLGQVRFGAATTLNEARERLKYDLYYQKNMSIAFDLSILIDTVKVVLLKIGAR